jgi:hypothetical protein
VDELVDPLDGVVLDGLTTLGEHVHQQRARDDGHPRARVRVVRDQQRVDEGDPGQVLGQHRSHLRRQLTQAVGLRTGAFGGADDVGALGPGHEAGRAEGLGHEALGQGLE